MNKWRFYIVKEWAWAAIQIHIYQKHEAGEYTVVQPMVAKREQRRDDGLIETPPPALSMSPEDVQALVDELGRNGFVAGKKPEDVTALQSHLQDMRAITFGKLNIEKP